MAKTKSTNRVDRLTRRAVKNYNKAFDAREPMETYEGSKAQKYMNKGHKLSDKASGIPKDKNKLASESPKEKSSQKSTASMSKSTNASKTTTRSTGGGSSYLPIKTEDNSNKGDKKESMIEGFNKIKYGSAKETIEKKPKAKRGPSNSNRDMAILGFKGFKSSKGFIV